MNDWTSLQLLTAMAVLILGPTGGVWIDFRRQLSTVVKRLDEDRLDRKTDHTETQKELKSLRIAVSGNAGQIEVLLDRTKR